MSSTNDILTIGGAVAFVLDGAGGAVSLDRSAMQQALSAPQNDGFVWVHIVGMTPENVELITGLGLDQFILDALMAEETRPRCTSHEDGVLLNLRGVNLDGGENPEDMISIRMWLDGRRVVSAGLRPLTAVRELVEVMKRRQSPKSTGDLVATLALRLADVAEPAIAALNEKIDALEETVLDEISPSTRGDLASVRRASIVLRRYMLPQKDALTTLLIEEFDWLGTKDHNRLHEAVERFARLGEELDAIRDRAQVVHDQIMDRRAEAMNRNMLILSVVASVFLPLGLVTGLLGINVGGIPGAGASNAFYVVCAILILITGFQAWLFKRIGLY